MPIRQAIQGEAQRLGFDWFGVTTPDPPLHLEVYHDWLADRRHGEMAYLETARARLRRADPRRILPDCQSILSLGIRYPAQLPDGDIPDDRPTDRPIGRVASYAWSDD